MEKLNRVAAIKRYFNQKDNISPEGQEVTMAELRSLKQDETAGGKHMQEIAELCAAALGCELEPPKTAG